MNEAFLLPPCTLYLASSLLPPPALPPLLGGPFEEGAVFSPFEQLVGAKSKTLKVQNPEKYNFHPAKLLQIIATVVIVVQQTTGRGHGSQRRYQKEEHQRLNAQPYSWL